MKKSSVIFWRAIMFLLNACVGSFEQPFNNFFCFFEHLFHLEKLCSSNMLYAYILCSGVYQTEYHSTEFIQSEIPVQICNKGFSERLFMSYQVTLYINLSHQTFPKSKSSFYASLSDFQYKMCQDCLVSRKFQRLALQIFIHSRMLVNFTLNIQEKIANISRK